MKNRILFAFGLMSISFLLAFQFCTVNSNLKFKSYEGLMFYNLETKEYYIEDIESGTDILLVFENEKNEDLDFRGMVHVEVHGLYNKNQNSIEVLSLLETSYAYGTLDE